MPALSSSPAAWDCGMRPTSPRPRTNLQELREKRGELARELKHAVEGERVADERVRGVREQLVYAEQGLSDAKSAARSAQSAAAVKGVPDDERRRQLRARADEAVTSAQGVVDAVSAAKQATKQSDTVEHYQAIVRALGPSGVRAGLLGVRLRKLQAGLCKICERAEWPSVGVTAGGSITIGTRPAQLCSESERWRAQAALQLTIAAITGSAAVVLDRADMLDREGRDGLEAAVGLVTSKTPISVILCATALGKLEHGLPEPRQRVPPGGDRRRAHGRRRDRGGGGVNAWAARDALNSDGARDARCAKADRRNSLHSQGSSRPEATAPPESAFVAGVRNHRRGGSDSPGQTTVDRCDRGRGGGGVSEKRYSVKRWEKDALQAAQMSVGTCSGGDTIGIDMLADDGSVFAHGHFDVETAIQFTKALSAEISQALTRAESEALRSMH